MSTQAQYYLTCDGGCGKQYVNPTDGQQVSEDPQEIIDDAIENGWVSIDDGNGTQEYCPKCKPS